MKRSFLEKRLYRITFFLKLSRKVMNNERKLPAFSMEE